MAKKNPQGPIHKIVPENDDRLRDVCLDCGYIAYQNPKIITGAICIWENKFLLCKRAIEPRKGYWTIPAGYLELNETTAKGAEREVWEEACAKTKVVGLVGIYEIPRISQIYFIHLAKMKTADFSPGIESQDVILCEFEDIPWSNLAFSSVGWALRQYKKNTIPAFGIHPS